MNPFRHTQTQSSAIHSWENEGGALAQEAVTASAMNRPSEGRQTLIAPDHFRTPGVPRVPQCYREKSSGADENALALPHVGIKTRFSRNEMIFNEGDRSEYTYKLVSGAVRLCKHMADGRRQIAEFLLPGDFFGFLQFGYYSFTAEAISDVAMICYTQRQVEQISNSTLESRGRLLIVLSQRLVGMQDHLMMLGRENAKERIAHFLLFLAGRLRTEENTPLALPMRRLDIADYLGLTIETVCRVLTDLKRAGIIGIPHLRQVVLKDIESLRRIAEGDDEILGFLDLPRGGA